MCPWGTLVRKNFGRLNVPIGYILKSEQHKSPRNLVGSRLKQLRRAVRPRVTQEDLCGRVARYGVVLTRTQVAKIEAGRRPVFDFEVAALARALKVPVQNLFLREPSKSAPKS